MMTNVGHLEVFDHSSNPAVFLLEKPVVLRNPFGTPFRTACLYHRNNLSKRQPDQGCQENTHERSVSSSYRVALLLVQTWNWIV